MKLVEGRVSIGENGADADDSNTGATSDATFESVASFVEQLDGIGDEHGCTVQAFDARYVAGRGHLERALDRADRARERGEAVARERAVEILLYAAGRRQIDRALEMGVSEGTQPVVVLLAATDDGRGDEHAASEAISQLVAPGEVLAEPDDDRLRAFFEISDAEMAATDAGLAALVGERVALLDVEK